MLSGEYLVLDGALALAIPTRFGQSMTVEPQAGPEISWKALEANGGVWLRTTLALDDIQSGRKLEDATGRLLEILHTAHRANPNILERGYRIHTQVDFPREWGLGTSSTLINNIADWFEIDAYRLLADSFGGSGYDIACARHDKAVLYRKRERDQEVTPVDFEPPFSSGLYFVFLNRKQDSKAAIAHYKTIEATKKADAITVANALTLELLNAPDLSTFARALESHETLLSEVLGQPTVKRTLFPDFSGSIKSLGAWGGDFVLVASAEDPRGYFRQKGYHTIFRYADMVK